MANKMTRWAGRMRSGGRTGSSPLYPQLHNADWLAQRLQDGATPEELARELGCSGAPYVRMRMAKMGIDEYGNKGGGLTARDRAQQKRNRNNQHGETE